MKRLVVDSNYMCWRAFHTMGHLSHGEVPTGVIYGFLREIPHIMADFDCRAVAFCFDSRESKRKEKFPAYKKQRHSKEHTEEEQKARTELFEQIAALRTRYLPRIGFKNVFYQEGYEGDDIMASLVDSLPAEDEIILVSADKDLYQLLSGRVSIYNPNLHKIYTLQSFFRQYGIEAHRWPKVLAIAGCGTDEIPGIPGVGEKTAIKYLLGHLPQTHKKFHDIQHNWATVMRNKDLVLLPFKGTETFPWQEDEINDEGWNEVTEALGMQSLKDKAPFLKKNEQRRPTHHRGFF